MLTTFSQLKQIAKIKDYTIDNVVFRLHYRATTFIFLIATILVTSRQYIGEHIRCLSDKGIPEHVMNTFCFFTTTFTMVKDYDADLLDKGGLPHPGVGSMGIGTQEEVKRHAYYQWVPFILFGQAIMFYIPHLIWKHIEGGKLRLLAEGLRIGVVTSGKDSIDYNGIHVPCMTERERKLANIRSIFIDRSALNRSWARWLIFCEIINMANVFLQAYFIQMFLSGHFYTLGIHILKDGLESSVDILDVVFPKVTKCTFHKFGPSGTIQNHDAMCVMALNVINEKIYTFLWFWLIFLAACSGLALLWRFASVILHATSQKFNKMVFATSCPGKLNPWRVLTVTRNCNYTDWLFLYYLSANMDKIIFKDLFISLASEMDEDDASQSLYARVSNGIKLGPEHLYPVNKDKKLLDLKEQ